MNQPKANTQTPANWPITMTNPSDEPAFLVAFHGLFAFTYNRETGRCEVGAVFDASKHMFGIIVFEVEGMQTKLLYSYMPRTKGDVDEPIQIKVDNPTVPGVNFLQSESQPELNWSRVPDLEGQQFHNRPLEKRTKNLRPRVYLHNGVFFTLGTTYPCTFKRVAENASSNSTELGDIARMPGAELTPGPTGHVILSVQQQEIRFYRPPQGKTVIMLFMNMCPKDMCKYDAGSSIKENRNDFYMYYRTFKKPSGHPEFHLIRSSEPCEPDTDKDIVNSRTAQMRLVSVLDKYTLSSRNAPCGGISFGQSDGLS